MGFVCSTLPYHHCPLLSPFALEGWRGGHGPGVDESRPLSELLHCTMMPSSAWKQGPKHVLKWLLFLSRGMNLTALGSPGTLGAPVCPDRGESRYV